MSGTKVLLLALIVCLFLVAVSLSSNTPKSEQAHDVGIRTETGEMRLSQLKGKVVLLDLWATWCGPCRMSMPGLQALYNLRHKDGFEILGVDVSQGPPSDSRKMVKEMEITYPTGQPTAVEDMKAYSGGGIPKMILVDKRGMIRWRQEGYSPSLDDTIASKVDELLKE